MVNAYMSHLRSSRKTPYQATLAYLIPFREATLFADYQKRVFDGAKAKADTLGYALEPIWLKELQFNFASLSRILRSRGVPGVVVIGRDLNPADLEDFDWNSFASATWGYSLKIPLHRAAHHDVRGVRLILAKLRKKGYKRIALVLSLNHDLLSDHTILPTFYYDEKHHSKSEWVRSVPYASWNPCPSARENIKKWIVKNKPEVIIGDKAVWGILEEMKWIVPDDVSFASPFWSSEWPGIAGINHQPEVIGGHTIELLATQLLQNERGLPTVPKLLLSEGNWVDGDSVPDLSKETPSRTSIPAYSP